MPANEQTWRNQKTLHVVFGVSALVMAVATIWMTSTDHNREWKDWQLKDRKKDAWMIQARRDALEDQYSTRMDEFQAKIRKYETQPIPAELVEEFKATVREQDVDAAPAEKPRPAEEGDAVAVTPVAVEAPANDDDPQFEDLHESLADYKAALDELEKVRQSAAEADEKADAVLEAEEDVIEARRDVFGAFHKFIREARRVENAYVGEKKSVNGERTAVVSELGIKIGQGASEADIGKTQERVDGLNERLADLTENIADAKRYRTDLESIVARVDADKTLAQKELGVMETELARLDEQVEQYTSNVGEWVTRWPVLNALYSGNVRIEQNWLPDMTINYNFAHVARFDRCATCHRAIAKTAPGTATEPLYPTLPEDQRDLTVELATPAEAPANPNADNALRMAYGMELSAEGIIEDADVTVHYVLPESPAAKAGIESGDVLRGIDGNTSLTKEAAEEQLLTLMKWGAPAKIALRRGLDHPFTSHPRLDLFITDSSPHPMKDVGCTICHDGQGSGTSFPYTSHTPNDADQQKRWAPNHGWFDNHHWIFPMKPARFAESNCLKCHHQKGGLEPSERFPEPPAPKLVEGWSTVEEFGCFGCHEINGYEGPETTVGPDVRLEPTYYEAAAGLLRFKSLTDEQREMAQALRDHPENDDARRQLRDSLTAKSADSTDDGDAEGAVADAPAADPDEAAEVLKLANLLKDVETPGVYRKVGPSLRFIDSKVDYDWLYSWIRKPKDFRPSTKMPQFFGLHEHLSEHDDLAELDESRRFEPIEIRALTEYLLKSSDEFEYLEAPKGITEEASAERGQWLFESRGCLACHSHEKFPDIKSTQGPDLSRMGAKLKTDKGRQWLYSWVREPHRYHSRTRMPDVFLDSIEEKDAQNKPTGKVTDPAADVTAFLLGVETDWAPQDVPSRTELTADEEQALGDLALEWLASDAIPRKRAAEYLQTGIPEKLAPKLKADERLLVGINDGNRTDRQLEFVARRTIGKYGCFGCHDIPGFEDAKPIGTALVDWGRKETSKLAFENIHKFLETHGINPETPEHDGRAGGVSPLSEPPENQGADAPRSPQAEEHGDAHAVSHGHLDPGDEKFSADESYYIQSINSHGRDGFLWQKLRYPRSFDYKTTRNKNYNERLRMPKFPFSDAEREAVATFVLGLVKEPPAAKYIYKPDARQQAIVDGRQVLDRFNCGGCHTLRMDQWEFDYAADTFDSPSEVVDFPFLSPRFTEKEIADSKAKDNRGMMHAKLHGQPVVDEETGAVLLVDDGRQAITKEDIVEAAAEGEVIPAYYQFTLWRNSLINGEARLRGIDELLIPAAPDDIAPANGNAYPAWGGDLARYLFPRVVARGRETNPALVAKNAWAWLPPPLMEEGVKVQPDWLHGFLMDPYAIRPSTVMRMPNFHMSSDEAAKLVDYFAAASGAEFPYEYNRERRTTYLAELHENREDPFGEAMNIVVNKTYCVQCHGVADFMPEGDPSTFGPNLADLYERLRPKFMRDWIANPARILPYTAMPKNIVYNPDEPNLGGVSQELYHGAAPEQLQGVVDLLLNFDAYSRRNTSVTPLVQEANPPAAEGAPDAAGGEAAGDQADAESTNEEGSAEADEPAQ